MKRRRPVLLVLDKMLKAGTQRHVLHLLDGLSDGYEFHVVCLEGRGPWDDEVRRRGGRLHVYGLSRLYGPSGWQALHGLRALIRELEPGGVESFMFTAHVASAFSLRGLKAPLISSRREKVLWRRPWHIALRRLANRRVSRHLANSAAVAEDVITNEGVSRETVRVVENGLEIEAFTQEGPRMAEGPGRHAVVLAALKPVKQHGLLIEALAHDMPGDLTIHLVGDGPLRIELEKRVAELDMQRRIVFQGEIDPVLPALGQFDFAILPSRSEGSSNSLIECLGAGLPVVAFDVDGNSETLVDGVNGLLVPPGDLHAFAAAVRRLAEDDKLCSDMGSRACEGVRSRYSVETMCLLKRRHYEEVFQC